MTASGGEKAPTGENRLGIEAPEAGPRLWCSRGLAILIVSVPQRQRHLASRGVRIGQSHCSRESDDMYILV